MHSKGRNIPCLFVLLCLSYCDLSAQSKPGKYELGVDAGMFIYQGDLTPAVMGSFKTPSFAAGLHASRSLTKNMALRLDIRHGHLKGNDAAYAHPAWRQQRNLKFSTRTTELAALLVWTPVQMNQRLIPYLFGGLGYAFLNIKRDYSGYNAEYFAGQPVTEGLADDVAHRPPAVVPVLPLGAGLRYPISRSLSLSTEAAWRYVHSDYLDGFSKAGNPQKKDHYYSYSLGLVYSIAGNNNLRCPVWR